MNISLADKLKALRKTKKVSQEKLAEYLGVSFQAVSKWENGVTSPDITILPDIARYFGITVDELLQVQKIDEYKYLEECDSKAEALRRDGKNDEAILLLREAHKKFPNNIWAKEMLMSMYFDTDRVKYQNEIVELGSDIYHENYTESSNELFKGQAIKTIAQTYHANGNAEKAEEWSRKAHLLNQCREFLFMQLNDDKDKLITLFSYVNYNYLRELFFMVQRLGVLNNANNLYVKNIYLTVTKIFELVFPNNDMSYEYLRYLCGLYLNNAQYEIFSSNDESLIKKYITRAIECALKTVNIKAHTLTHPLFFGWQVEDAPTDNMQVVRATKEDFKYHAYDAYRNQDWFIELLAQLDNVN